MPTAAVDAGGASSFAHHMGLALSASGAATRTSSADRLGNIARRRHPHYVQKRTLRKPAIKSAICQQRTHHCSLITPEAVEIDVVFENSPSKLTAQQQARVFWLGHRRLLSCGPDVRFAPKAT